MALIYFVRPNRINASVRSTALYRFYSSKPCPKPQHTESQDKSSIPNNSETADKCSHDDSNKSLGSTQSRINSIKTNIAESLSKVESARKNFKGYAFQRVFDFTRKYEAKLEERFPQAVRASRLFINGFKSFFKDFVRYGSIFKSTRLGGQTLEDFSRKDLELYYWIPRETRKLLPMLFASSLPLAQYVILPIAYRWPRFWLTRHFWSPEQRDKFGTLDIQYRISHNRAIFRALQAKLPQIEKSEHYNAWNSTLSKLGSGQHPTVDEILAIKTIFAEPPYGHRSLSRAHMNHLCVLHDIGYFFKKSKLAYRSEVFRAMDAAIEREGGVQSLQSHELRDVCFMRGLNASELSDDDLARWLDQWLQVTKHIEDNQYLSLFLHLPILLTYNHPNNWKLLYPERK